MTTPDSDGPRDLDTIIADMEDTLAQLKRRRDHNADLEANAEAARRRRAFYIVPTAVAAAGLLGRRILTRPAGIAIGAAAVAAAGLVILTNPFAGSPPHVVEPPPIAAPPGVHARPHIGPPKGARPTPPPTGHPSQEQQQPRTSPTGEPPGTPPAAITPTPPDTPPPTGQSTDTRTCRIRITILPILRWGLLCTPPRL